MKLIRTLIILIFLLPKVALGLTFKSDGSVVDGKGNIIGKNGKKLFPKSCLLSDEFPKIFTYTKFKLKLTCT